MGTRKLIILVVAAALSAGCSASSLKASKDDGFKFVSQGLPDGRVHLQPGAPDPVEAAGPDLGRVLTSNPSAYGHPFRPLGFVFSPDRRGASTGSIVKPLYMLGGLAPEWFGLNDG